jgi:prolyl oligopeptidase
MRQLLLLLTAFLAAGAHAQLQDDPYLWLEDITGDKALTWVKEQNAITVGKLETLPEFKPLNDKFLSVLDSRERIPNVTKLGKRYYNFWRDAQNVRGLWRRATLQEYRKPAPKWETVIDLDQLATRENENWVWKGVECLFPKYERCVISLSRGGGDATVLREFDIPSKAFVKGGFDLPEAKSDVAWRSKDSLYVATDFGSGSLTTSGYPRQVKEWKRGTPLDSARLVYEASVSDVGVDTATIFDKGYPARDIIRRHKTFFTEEYFLRQRGTLLPIEVPEDATVSVARQWLFVRLRSDWRVGTRNYPQGALLATELKRFIQGERSFDVLFEPSERRSLASFTVTKNFVLVEELDNVRGRVAELGYRNGQWTRRQVDLPDFGDITVSAVDRNDSDAYWTTMTGFLTPSSLYLAKAGTDVREKLKSLPTFFDATGLKVEQFEATSKDDTKIPYFIVHREHLNLDGNAPTVLYGYGGFEVSMQPNYSGIMGNGWLARGGVWVLANIRGGGEFGPRWHQAALKENRQKAFDDFIAVAEDLIGRKITSPQHLGIVGGSNGGLLVGAVMLQRPELFGAVVCQVPLLDMQRYNKLLAGASWMAEYGDPDKSEEWAYLSKYSPYQNVSKEKRYPKVLFTTTTRDDRVHPAHARKMYARMKEQGHDAWYFENIEGGHGAGANNQQQAFSWAVTYTFLWEALK